MFDIILHLNSTVNKHYNTIQYCAHSYDFHTAYFLQHIFNSCINPFILFSEPVCELTLHVNHHALGGKLVPNVTTDVDCQHHCLKNRNCLGVDYDRRSKLCFQHMSSTVKEHYNDCCNRYKKVCKEGGKAYLYQLPLAFDYD